jgi:rhodanese-related sulfurtransferase
MNDERKTVHRSSFIVHRLVMRSINFLRILLVTLALTGYSAWVQKQRLSPGIKPLATDDVAGIPLLRRDDARALWEESSTLFVDVRSSIDYEFGHIQGAISIPDEEFEKRFPDQRQRLERAKTIIVYCQNRDCGKSLWSAIRLRNAGLTQAVIYPEGWNDWVLHDLPTAGTGR